MYINIHIRACVIYSALTPRLQFNFQSNYHQSVSFILSLSSSLFRTNLYMYACMRHSFSFDPLAPVQLSVSHVQSIIISQLVAFCRCHSVCFKQMYICIHACVIHSALTPCLQFNFQSVIFSQLSSVS